MNVFSFVIIKAHLSLLFLCATVSPRSLVRCLSRMARITRLRCRHRTGNRRQVDLGAMSTSADQPVLSDDMPH
jgi:hypothetical protein